MSIVDRGMIGDGRRRGFEGCTSDLVHVPLLIIDYHYHIGSGGMDRLGRAQGAWTA